MTTSRKRTSRRRSSRELRPNITFALPEEYDRWIASKSMNDPGLTAENIKLTRIYAGCYEHMNGPTGTRWVVERTQDEEGPEFWVYFRTPIEDGKPGAARAYYESYNLEDRVHDRYETKRDAVWALVHRLQNRTDRVRRPY